MSSKFLHLIHILGSWASQVGTYQWVSYSLLKNVKQVPIIFAVHPWNPAYVPLLGSGIVIQNLGATFNTNELIIRLEYITRPKSLLKLLKINKSMNF